MYMLKDMIDMVEVGMRIGLSSRENGCYFGGTVTKKEWNAFWGFTLEVDVDDTVKEIRDIEKYSIYALIGRDGQDLLKINQDDIRAFYFPDAYTDPVDAFFEMVEEWNRSGEYEKEVMATVLMERMNADVLEKILEKVSWKRSVIKLVGDLLDRREDDSEIEDTNDEKEEEFI